MPGTARGREEGEQPVTVERLAAGQPEPHGACRCARVVGSVFSAAGTPSPQLGRCGREHLAHRVVELADAGEPGAERDLRERQVGGLDEHPGGLGPLGAGQGDRAGADLGDELAVQWRSLYPSRPGETADALAVDDAVGDEAHRPAHDIGAHVPLGRTGRGVGPAALAGPEPGELGGGRGRVEADVGPLRRDGRTARPAVDAGRT